MRLPTCVLLGSAAVAAFVALYKHPDWDRASIAFALAATIAGLVVDPILAERQRRKEALVALAHELSEVSRQFKRGPLAGGSSAPKTGFYPRVSTLCLDTCIASGLFADRRDRPLHELLFEWRRKATTFNQRLTATEAILHRVMRRRDPNDLHAQVTGSAVSVETRETLERLKRHLADAYPQFASVPPIGAAGEVGSGSPKDPE